MADDGKSIFKILFDSPSHLADDEIQRIQNFHHRSIFIKNCPGTVKISGGEGEDPPLIDIVTEVS